MATERLRKTPFKIEEEDDITPENLGRINKHTEERLRELDLRQVAQTTELASSATLDDVISKLNDLLNKLNLSELTED